MIKDLKIQHKLFLLSGIPIIFLLLLNIFSYTSLTYQKNLIDNVVNKELKELRRVSVISQEILFAHNELGRIVRWTSLGYMTKEESKGEIAVLAKNIADLEEEKLSLTLIERSDQEKEILEALREYKEWIIAIDEIILIDNDLAKIYLGSADKTINSLVGNFNKLETSLEEIAVQQSIDAERNFNTTVGLIISVFLLSIVVSLFVAFFFGKNIIDNLTKLIGMLKYITRTKDLSKKVEIDSNDEVGSLAEYFKHFIAELKNYNENLESMVEERTLELNEANKALHNEISERLQTEDELIRSKREWEDTFDIMADAITIHDKDFNIIKANRSAMKILDLPILKNNKIKCYKYYHGSDHPPEGCASCTCVKSGIPTTFETFEPHLNKYLEIRAMPRFDSRNKIIGVIHLVRDISSKKEMEEKLKGMSITDELTGLYNRRGFFTLIEQQLKVLNRAKEKAYMLYIDIDNFKEINDSLGHSTGDSALLNTAGIMKSTFRESDIIARIGGDEFIIFPAGKSEFDVNKVIKRLQSNIDSYNLKEKRGYTLSMSIGMAAYEPENPRSIDHVLADADKSMYDKKRQKKMA